MVQWKFSTLCTDGGHAANFMQMLKKMQYFMEKIHETTGMAIPSMSRMFESYSGAVLHPSLHSHLTKRFEVYLMYPQFKFEFKHLNVQKMQYIQEHQDKLM
jgi:hypothetical protein